MHMVTNTTEAAKSEDFFVIFIITYKYNNQHDWDNRFTYFFFFISFFLLSFLYQRNKFNFGGNKINVYV